MKLKSVGDVFLTRTLDLNTENEVIIKIGKPQPFPDHFDYYCPYQILGIKDEQVR